MFISLDQRQANRRAAINSGIVDLKRQGERRGAIDRAKVNHWFARFHAARAV